MIDSSTMSVLIVDDAEGMRKSIRGMLMVLRMGKAFHFAEDGKDGLNILRKEPVDLAIIDWNMPVMNGVEMLGNIREDRALRDMPIIMVTAEANQEIVAEAAESDIDAYLLKPITIQTLSDKISYVLEKANNPTPMIAHLKNARNLEDKGNIDGAIEEAKKAVYADRNSSRPIRELAYYLYKKGNTNEAKKWFIHAAEMNKLDVFAFHYLGQIYLERNQINKAAEFFNKAMDISPRHISRAIDFGKILVKKGMFQKAQGVFNKALSLTNDPLTLHEDLARYCLENEAYHYAIDLMKFVIEQVPKRHDLLYRIGIAYEKINDPQEAVKYLLKASANDPNNIDIKIHIAKNLIEQRQVLRAEQVIRAILSIDPYHSEARSLLIKCL